MSGPFSQLGSEAVVMTVIFSRCGFRYTALFDRSSATLMSLTV